MSGYVICQCCGAPLPQDSIRLARKYCTRACAQVARRLAHQRRRPRYRATVRQCGQCRREFVAVLPWHVFCGHTCRSLASAHRDRDTAETIDRRYAAALREIRAARRQATLDETAWTQAADWAGHLGRWAPDVAGLAPQAAYGPRRAAQRRGAARVVAAPEGDAPAGR